MIARLNFTKSPGSHRRSNHSSNRRSHPDRVGLRPLRICTGVVLVGAVDGHPRSNPMARIRDPRSRDGAIDCRTPARAGTLFAACQARVRPVRVPRCIVVGAGGGRFVSYAMRATLNPPFTLKIAVGQQFPTFALTDQNDSIHHGPASAASATLIYIYRGDYDRSRASNSPN